jgi:hypothetical protein
MTGIEPALSVWELACHDLTTLAIRINRLKPVRASDREIPRLFV